MSAAAQNRSDTQLIERARIAYFKAGGIDQPNDASDVIEMNGITTVTLRNINGVLAMYRLGGAPLRRAHKMMEGGMA